jgi:hypothetical protein
MFETQTKTGTANETAYSYEKMLINHPLEYNDIQAVGSPQGWLTATCIAHLVCAGLKELKNTSDTNFVDPTWLREWELTGLHRLSSQPAFLTPQQGVDKVRALVFPYSDRTHWSLAMVLFESKEIKICSSLVDRTASLRIVMLLSRLINMYESELPAYATNGMKWTWSNLDAPQQSDEHSCGIYTVVNSLTLVDEWTFFNTRMSPNCIWRLREKAVRFLSDRYFGNVVGGFGHEESFEKYVLRLLDADVVVARQRQLEWIRRMEDKEKKSKEKKREENESGQ